MPHFDTRAGTIEVAIPDPRSGGHFPDWLLARRRRAERALTTCWVCRRGGCSGWWNLQGDNLSKSQVSENAKDLDEAVEAFRTSRCSATKTDSTSGSPPIANCSQTSGIWLTKWLTNCALSQRNSA
jgi:hypothetical protein